MTYLFIFVLGILVGSASFRFFINQQLKTMTTNLKTITKRSTNERLRISSGQKEIKKLVKQINLQLEKEQQTRLLIDEEFLLLRQAMTNMSHDLRTPLTSILGYLKLAEKDTITPAENKRYLAVVKSKTINLNYLIEQFFELSRIESKILVVVKEPVDLTSIIQEILASYYEDFIQKQTIPTITIPEHPVWGMGDKEALRRVFNNLLQNMLKHNASSVCLSLEEQPEKQTVLLTFKNHAPNLSPEDVKQIFNRFYTADRMRSGQNTGLGLTIVKELVIQMGGEIDARLQNQQLAISIKLAMKE